LFISSKTVTDIIAARKPNTKYGICSPPYTFKSNWQNCMEENLLEIVAEFQ